MKHCAFAPALALALCSASLGQDSSTFDPGRQMNVITRQFPGTCKAGQLLIRSDLTAGQNVFICGTSNDWHTVGGSAPSGSPNSFLFNNAGVVDGTSRITWEGSDPVLNPTFIGSSTQWPITVLFASSSYTGTFPAQYIVQIDSLGSPDTFRWSKNGGPWTNGVPITAPWTTIPLSDGVSAYFGANTGHAANDGWVIGVNNPSQMYHLVDSPSQAPSVAVSQTGGNLPAGIYYVEVTYATPEGITYGYNSGTSADLTITTNTGELTVTNFPPITDPRVIGWNVYLASIGSGYNYCSSNCHIAAFVPKQASPPQAVLSVSPSLLPLQIEVDYLNSSGPMITSHADGYSTAVAQATDDGLLFPRASANTVAGFSSGRTLQSFSGDGSRNYIIGDAFNLTSTGYNNVALGHAALDGTTSGHTNIAIGADSPMRQNLTGANNVAVGENALRFATDPQGNVAVGSSSLISNANSSHNTAVGQETGRDSSGQGNVFIGYQVGGTETGSNQLMIDNSNTPNPLIRGDFLARTLTFNSSMQIVSNNTQPTCAVGIRGTIWVIQGANGVKDSVQVCAKDASNAYAWRTLY